MFKTKIKQNDKLGDRDNWIMISDLWVWTSQYFSGPESCYQGESEVDHEVEIAISAGKCLGINKIKFHIKLDGPWKSIE